MELWHSVVLGIVQGLAEFLPISSSGHLIIVSTMLQGQSLSMSFEVALHVGTLVALLVYFWKDWLDLLQGSLQTVKEKKLNPRSQMLINLIVGTIPAAVIGKIFEHEIETFFSTRAILVCFPLIIVGLLLWWVDRNAAVSRKIMEFKPVHGLIVGIAQACALFPGTSRSGATIIACRILGLDRSDAARFSFLLGTPITAGAALLKADEIIASIHLPEFYVGMLVSAITGWLVIGFLMRYLRTYGFGVFAVYRVILALVSMAILLSLEAFFDMKSYLRRSIFTKAVALGFIVMILLGNAWLVLFLTGQSGALWLTYALAACMGWTLLAGLGMGFRIFQHQLQKEPDDDAAV